MLPEERPKQFRSSFDQVAEDYDAARPGYPLPLITDIVTLAALPAPARILEVGCGTGQATLPFAQRGDHLTCLDIGPALLRIARENLAAYPNVQFHLADFEAWTAPAGAFDLVMSATAFHWISPDIGYLKAAQLLKETGSLALFANEHCGFNPAFAADLYEVDRALVPDWPDPRNPPELERRITEAARTLDATRLFAPAVIKTYPWSQVYTTASYLRLLNTYSNYRSLGDATRTRLLQAIADLLDQKYAGTTTRRYRSVLFLAHK